MLKYYDLIKKKSNSALPTSLAVMNMFQGIKTPMPCIRKMKYTKLYVSGGEFKGTLASSNVKFLKFNSSSGEALSQDSCCLVGCCRHVFSVTASGSKN